MISTSLLFCNLIHPDVVGFHGVFVSKAPSDMIWISPLDGYAGAPSESASYSKPAVKTKVPCYFYHDGFCSRGEKCYFLHDIDDSVPRGKSSKTTSVNADSIPSENNTSIGKESRQPSTSLYINSSGSATDTGYDSKVNLKGGFQQPTYNGVPQQRSSPQLTDSESEETATSGPGSLLPAEGFVHTTSHEGAGLFSEKHVDGHIDIEERGESSPGFDVLVDGKSENLVCEDDQENSLELDTEQNNLSSQFFDYEFENQAEYDPAYSKVEHLYDNEIYGANDPRDDDHSLVNIKHLPVYPNGKLVHSILSHKWKLMPRDLALKDQDSIDLRDHLRRCRRTDSRSFTVLLERHESSRLIAISPERSKHHGMKLLHSRFTSLVRNITVESFNKHGTLSNGRSQHSSLGLSQHYKEKKRVKTLYASSEFSRKDRPRDRSNVQNSTVFTGPKTLAQIKQEKINTAGNGDSEPDWRSLQPTLSKAFKLRWSLQESSLVSFSLYSDLQIFG